MKSIRKKCTGSTRNLHWILIKCRQEKSTSCSCEATKWVGCWEICAVSTWFRHWSLNTQIVLINTWVILAPMSTCVQWVSHKYLWSMSASGKIRTFLWWNVYFVVKSPRVTQSLRGDYINNFSSILSFKHRTFSIIWTAIHPWLTRKFSQ